ncbi:MAG: DUF86 domain-containing protein [Oscillospiraceae bacterium]|nr:DUF86 domain-containing protein [Oscillospiraceae bacterium]
MNTKAKDLNAASHMLAHCERIERYLDRCNRSLEEFMNDELVQDGVTMQLLAMGELTTHFTDEFKATYSEEIDWRNFKQLRNVCAHRYGTLDYKIIWDIVTDELPTVKRFFAGIVEEEEK